ncbi:PDGLE domain-containing protein [Paenibacillus validus]|uniref:PDGLE domain-containing protein n=1 Tax=Paenibacillus validus TaxID=44253 RepID=A0A7X2Z8S0_9BACL|nr:MULTISPECIES: PDGLE domain-containing protein [Paenibacillus]MED4604065.1 PDGLE domain-containing protein [Paenibacillus validus]MED4605432.1 PDGLE domain-containing protein [Paenibacillus validus]MUG70439.1 hypothetical protein [Paenibacillus validus]
MNKPVRFWLIASLLIAAFVSLLASSHPDGFEKAGEEIGYIEQAGTLLGSWFPDYTFPGVEGWYSGSLAGIFGTVLTFVLFLLLGKLISRKTR